MWRSLAGENRAARETSSAHDSETCRRPYHCRGERRWRTWSQIYRMVGPSMPLVGGLEVAGCRPQGRRDPLVDQTQVDSQNTCAEFQPEFMHGSLLLVL